MPDLLDDLQQLCLERYRTEPLFAVALATVAVANRLDRVAALLEELVDLADSAAADLKRAGEELTLARHRAGNS